MKVIVTAAAIIEVVSVVTVFYDLTFLQTTNYGLFQTERLSRQPFFKFDENGGKFSKRVENTVGNGKIARYEQFLLFPQCFQKN